MSEAWFRWGALKRPPECSECGYAERTRGGRDGRPEALFGALSVPTDVLGFAAGTSALDAELAFPLTSLDDAEREVRKWGFGDLLDDDARVGASSPEEMYVQICRRVGVSEITAADLGARADDPVALKRARAWYLHNFLFWHFCIKGPGEPRQIARRAVQLGRLIEWWRWRSEGHDRRAASKRNSEASLPDARAALARNRGFDTDWHEDARQEAMALKRANRKRRRWDIAKELAPKYGKTPRHISEIIKFAVP